MKKLLLLSILFASTIQISSAQKQYYKWYFGNQAAIDFVSGSAVALTNGAMNAIDNPASISDANGNLLFYCDGNTVWNKNHIVMPNGSGLLGHLSGGHAATVVQQPGSANLYYLFTMDAFAGSNGLRYNVIDMNLNGGLGDIVAGQKNIMLLNPASEQIVPVLHANGNDIWIVTHPWNATGNTYSYLITCNGIDTIPVVSLGGITRYGNVNLALGQMTVNSGNNIIASACFGGNAFETYQFNNTTGVLSNCFVFAGYNNAWGLEFSPDGTKLYLTGWTTQYVYQFDLTNYNISAISASQVNLGNVTGPGSPYFTGYMQLAPDGKIYMAVYADDFLAVISNPDVAGAGCNLIDDGFYLGGKTSSAGLPDKIIAKAITPFSLDPDTTYCGNFSQILSTGNANTLWSTGTTAAQITVTAAGTYWAQLSNGCGIAADTIVITQTATPPISIGSDTSICNGEVIVLTPSPAYPNYLWSDGSIGTTLSVSSPGIYWVEVNTSGCASRDSVTISNGAVPFFNLGTDTFLCGEELLLAPNILYSQYHWQDNTTDSVYHVTQTGKYSVTITNSCGSASDEINVQISADECALAVPTAFTPNGDGRNDVFRVICHCPVERFMMHVYNRWGELVFESHDITDGWDGTYKSTAQPLSVFVYYIEYFNYCGQKMKHTAGNVTLVR